MNKTKPDFKELLELANKEDTDNINRIALHSHAKIGLNDASKLISGNFSWDTTAEGGEFWRYVYNRLKFLSTLKDKQ